MRISILSNNQLIWDSQCWLLLPKGISRLFTFNYTLLWSLYQLHWDKIWAPNLILFQISFDMSIDANCPGGKTIKNKNSYGKYLLSTFTMQTLGSNHHQDCLISRQVYKEVMIGIPILGLTTQGWDIMCLIPEIWPRQSVLRGLLLTTAWLYFLVGWVIPKGDAQDSFLLWVIISNQRVTQMPHS